MGLRVHGRDVHSASHAEINAIADRFVDALNAIPPDGYLQAVFETGDHYDDLADAYEARSAADSHPLLRRSRKLRGAICREEGRGKKPRITYWLGWRKALPAAGLKFSSLQEITKERVHNAGQALANVVEVFCDAMAEADIDLEFLDEHDILVDLHRALNPSRFEEADPPFFAESVDDLHHHKGSANVLLRNFSLGAQLPLGDMLVADTALALDEPPMLQRVIGVTRYPRATRPDWPNHLMYDLPPETPFRLVVTHVATNKLLRTEKLEKRHRRLGGHLGGRFYAPQDLVRAFESHQAFLQVTEDADAAVFDTSVQVVVSGRDHYELDQATSHVHKAFSRSGTYAATRRDEQLSSWLSTLPGNGHAALEGHLVRTHQMLTRNCAHLTPYWLPTTDPKEPDLLMQTPQNTWRGFSVGIIEGREDASGLIIGKTGSGKTFLFTLLFKLGCLDRGGHLILTDIKGPQNSSYYPLCQLLGGTYVCLDQDSSASFNPFPLMAEVFGEDGSYHEKSTQSLLKLLYMMGAPSHDQNPDKELYLDILRDSVRSAYLGHREASRHIMLEDLVKALGHYKPGDEKLRWMAKELGQRLNIWCKAEGRARLINRPEPFDLRNRFMVFDFAGLKRDEDLSSVLIATLADRIWSKLRQLPLTTPKFIGLDEAWSLFGNSPTATEMIEELYRTARSSGAVCLALTQHHNDVLNTPAGQAIVSCSSMLYLMRHIAGRAEVAKAFNLTPREQALFADLRFVGGEYAEALVRDANRGRSEVIRYAPTPFDLWCDTSRPADVQLRRDMLDQPGASLLNVIETLAAKYPHGTPKTEQEAAEDYHGYEVKEGAAA
jgi:hypothetical protein